MSDEDLHGHLDQTARAAMKVTKLLQVVVGGGGVTIRVTLDLLQRLL